MDLSTKLFDSVPRNETKSLRCWQGVAGPSGQSVKKGAILPQQHLPHHLPLQSLPALLGLQQASSTTIRHQIRPTPRLVGSSRPLGWTGQAVPQSVPSVQQGTITNTNEGKLESDSEIIAAECFANTIHTLRNNFRNWTWVPNGVKRFYKYHGDKVRPFEINISVTPSCGCSQFRYLGWWGSKKLDDLHLEIAFFCCALKWSEIL